MTSRILSLAAVIGLLGAAGCSGGGTGATSTNGILPKTPVLTTGKSGNSSVQATFLIPESALQRSTSSAGRSAQYLSPGTGGLDILLGNGQPFTVGAGAAGNAQSSAAATDNATYPYPPGGTGVATTVSILTGSYQGGVTPIIGQTLRLVDQNTTAGTTYVSATFTVSSVAANNTILGGSFSSTGATATTNGGYSVGTPAYNSSANLNTPTGAPNIAPAGSTAAPVGRGFPSGSLAFFTQTSSNSAGQQFLVGTQAQPGALTPAALAPNIVSGTIPAGLSGTGATGTYTYQFAPSGFPGYYVFTFTASGLAAGTAYTLGVVTLDYTKNFVLSEAQQVISTPALGGQAVAAFTLKPVVNGVYAPAPTIVQPPVNFALTAPALALNAGLGGTYETTIFATDEMGFSIPTIGTSLAANAPAAGTMITIAPVAAAAVIYKVYTAPANAAGPSLTQAPTAATGGAIAATLAPGILKIGPTASDYVSIFGTFFNATSSTANAGPILGAAGSPIGNPVNMLCQVATTGVTQKATIASTAIPNNAVGGTDVVGFVFTPGTNTPAASTVVALPTIDCTPGIGAIIN